MTKAKVPLKEPPDLGIFTFYITLGDNEQIPISWEFGDYLDLGKGLEGPLTKAEGERLAKQYVADSQNYFVFACKKRQVDPATEKFHMEYTFQASRQIIPACPSLCSGVAIFHIDRYLDKKYMAPFEEHVSCALFNCGHELAFRHKNEKEFLKIVHARRKDHVALGDRVKCPVCQKWTTLKSGRGGGYWTDEYRTLDKLLGDKIWAEVPKSLLEGEHSFNHVKKAVAKELLNEVVKDVIKAPKASKRLKQAHFDKKQYTVAEIMATPIFTCHKAPDNKTKVCDNCGSSKIDWTCTVMREQDGDKDYLRLVERVKGHPVRHNVGFFQCATCHAFLVNDSAIQSLNVAKQEDGSYKYAPVPAEVKPEDRIKELEALLAEAHRYIRISDALSRIERRLTAAEEILACRK